MASIVLIEDDPMVLRTTSAVLRSAGHLVWAYDDARGPWRDGVAARADLIIADWVLEAGDLVRRVKSLESGPPVLIITGLPTNRPAAQAAGADAIMIKPFRIPALQATISRLVSGGTDT